MDDSFRQNTSKNAKKFICKDCDFKCSKKSNYEKHLLTLKHKTATFGRKNIVEYKCDICDVKCCYKSDYQRHISSLKHKKRVNNAKRDDQDTEEKENIFYCKYCDYTCRYKSVYDKHVNTIRHLYKSSKANKNDNVESHTQQNEELKEIILHQNELYQQQMREQQEQYNQQIKQQQEQHNKQIQELIPKLQQVTTINNTTTNNNTKFNLNFFLNEQCKDAISIQTFMRDLNIGIKELEHMGNVGYLQGMISIMSNTLCAMDIYKRPVHCTDLKRETIYIKDGDTWKKDNANNDDLKKVIDDVADVNYRNLQLWETQHPEAFECDTPDNIEYCKIALESLGGCDNNEEQAAAKLKKIVKHVVRDLYVK